MRDDTIRQLSDTTLTSESRVQNLVRTGQATPRFLQGVFPFAGRGIVDIAAINHELQYAVPKGKTAEVLYVRAGNSSEALIYIALVVNGQPVRYFPLSPSGTQHIPLSITETYPAGTQIEIWLGAPKNLTGLVVIDVGLVEIQTKSP